MKQFVRGQKVRLTDLTAATNLKVALSVSGLSPHLSFDISCFGVDAADKLSDDRYFIFYNQKSSPCNSLVALGAQANDKEVFQINLSQLPTTIRKLVFTITVDGAGTMSQVANGYLRILDSGTEVARFDFAGTDFKDEKAIIAAELYYKDAWRFAAVGQGFNGGLNALLKHFGGEEAPETPAASSPVNVQKPAQVSAPPPAAAPQKVVLDKPNQSHKVSLTKANNNQIVVRAQWSDNGDGRDDNDDLDLRVGILYSNGQMRMIHADDLGNLNQDPYVQHLGDSRQPGEEVVKVRSDISRLIGGKIALVFSVYSAVQNGAVAVASLKPKMRLEYGDQIIECVYDYNPPPPSKSFFGSRKSNEDIYIYTYVIGIAVIDGDTAEIKPSGAVSLPRSEATPRLSWAPNGTPVLTMDGPEIFKRN